MALLSVLLLALSHVLDVSQDVGSVRSFLFLLLLLDRRLSARHSGAGGGRPGGPGTLGCGLGCRNQGLALLIGLPDRLPKVPGRREPRSLPDVKRLLNPLRGFHVLLQPERPGSPAHLLLSFVLVV